MNLLFRSVRANFMLAVWISRSVSPRAQRVARKRSPGVDRYFGMTLDYRLAMSPLKRKRESIIEFGRMLSAIGLMRDKAG